MILGILAATALPRFVDMSDAAAQAAVDGVAGNLASASALNYANAVANAAGVTSNTAVVVVTACTGAGALLQGGLPAGYTITDTDTAATLGAEATCTINGRDARTADFLLVGVPN